MLGLASQFSKSGLTRGGWARSAAHTSIRHIAEAQVILIVRSKLERHVLVHSFHSQVFETLAELDYEPDVIVALDSHFDVHLPLKNTLILM